MSEMLRYKIIGDSCMDLTDEMRKDPHFQAIPLTLKVGDAEVVDDETFDQKNFLELIHSTPTCAKTACPSPQLFKEAYECDAEDIYVITLSGKLSGTYNSAVTGRQMYVEEHGHKNIAVIDSWSAASGEVRLALFIQELCEQGLAFDEVVKKAEHFKTKMKTFFVLETLDTLRKNGRLGGLQALFANTLNIKPVMAGDNGEIVKIDQARGMNKALKRMCSIAVNALSESEEYTPVIAHCNNAERAKQVKEELLKLFPFKDIIITKTAGVSTVYAEDGGIVLAL